MQDDIQYLRQNNDEPIGAWIKSFDRKEHSAYHPHNFLFLVRQGQLHFRVGSEELSFTAPVYLLVRKNTLGYYRKSWRQEEEYADTLILALREDLVTAAIGDLSPLASTVTSPPIHELAPNAELDELFLRLLAYFDTSHSPAPELISAEMSRAIRACVAAAPATYQLFKDLTTPIAVHVRTVVDHHYKLGLSVEELASLAGMSLSSFYRAFKKEFGESPHQWLMYRRLQAAFELLRSTNKTVTEVGYETGFKDPAHFSRRFKRQFGLPPSQLKFSE
ncbi:MAG: helix-turn-helix transcriptional regulator [Bacteroidota bacterium]